MKAIMFVWVILAFGGMLPLEANVEKYFKKAEGKQPYNRMRNIDFLYVINLDKRPEKFALCEAALNPYGIRPYRFSAVNGWELPLTVINDVGVKLEPWMEHNHWGTYYSLDGGGMPEHEIIHQIGRNYFCHCMSRGAVAIVLSHLSVLQDAYDSGYETVWVMEDDIQVIRNPLELCDLIDKLDETVGQKKWDILFTDRDTKNQAGEYVPCLGHAWRPNFTPENPARFSIQKHVGRDFRKIGARYGAYSMIVRRSGMQKILNFIKKYNIFLPYDMEFYLPSDMQLYSVRHDVVSTIPQAASDNGAANYMK
jgi:GR25 family glycosyltransferase involved in LPS biosynthesis